MNWTLLPPYGMVGLPLAQAVVSVWLKQYPTAVMMVGVSITNIGAVLLAR